jgi:triosephosphate isomerase
MSPRALGFRRPLIAGNWKMHKTIAESLAFAAEMRALPLPPEVEIVVAPPFTALEAFGRAIAETPLELGAQTMHESDHGPFTGEISPAMLVETGVTFVILGHSERRAFCGETDSGVNRKVRAALAHGITPIVAVGESQAEHAAGETLERVLLQTRAAFASVEPADVARCVVAYEPIWAIGSGLTDDPENANAVIGAIRGCVDGLADARLLYGGSMKGPNAAAFLAQPHIDGGLIGGASLTPAAFLEIVDAARVRARRVEVGT